MNRFGKLFFASLGFAACGAYFNQSDVLAQSSTVSSETTVETRGVGFKGANVFNPKYKERIGTYTEQIQMGLTKGWLTSEEGEHFSKRLEDMKKQEAAAAAKGWVKADVDAIDKVFTQFNIDLTKAANKPAPSATPAVKTSAPSGAAPSVTPAKTTSKTTTKTTSKPAAKSAAKAKPTKTTSKTTVSKTTK